MWNQHSYYPIESVYNTKSMEVSYTSYSSNSLKEQYFNHFLAVNIGERSAQDVLDQYMGLDGGILHEGHDPPIQ